MVNRLILLFAVCVMANNLTVCAAEPEAASTHRPRKILFVGNSFTYAQGGVDKHLRALAASRTPAIQLQVDSATQGGATLKTHVERKETHHAITAVRYDVIILQGDIPEIKERNPAPFLANATLLHQEVKKSGAKTAFFMAWPYERLNWIDLDGIAQAHREISSKLDAPVAPVGVAFANAMSKQPELNMLAQDKEHESIHGVYLAACVIYATLFEESPAGFAYAPQGVSKPESAFLQQVAWETVQQWRNPEQSPTE